MDSMNGKRNEEYSHIQDKGEIGFIDYDDNASVCTYKPEEEGPIVISVPFPLQNGKPRSVLVGETSSDPITITNTTSEPVELWKVDIYDSNPKESFTVSLMEPPSANTDLEDDSGFVEFFCLEDRVLQPGQTLTIWLSCKPKGIGLHQTAVHFDLGSDRIERVVLLFVEDKISKSLASNKPYSRERRKKSLVIDKNAADTFVAGERPPPRRSNRGSRFHLAEYPIPKHIRELVGDEKVPDCITEGVTRGNYGIYFTTLINLEEIQVEENMQGYNMEHIYFRKKGKFLTLEVPGLAERRPSLVKGDDIYVKLAAEDSNEATRIFQGYIHRVEAEEVYLKFDRDEEFHSRHNSWALYNVQFTYNRLSMRKLYQAIEVSEFLDKELLFPSESTRKRQIRRSRLSPLSSILNEEQKCAIEMILGCKGGPPYVIYGPPGTGKTITLVETILQLYTIRKGVRLLVCAPSNSAADHILEKLVSEKEVSFGKNDILRLNAVTRPFVDYQSDLQFCSFEESSFNCPPLNILMRYRIIISTYASASQLYAEGIRRGHFSHIFLDEAGQASEPETLIPLSHLCQKGTVVVLAGDPMQLGPVIHSRYAESYGLGKSYLARLFEYEFYNMGNENYVTKLVQNYRCHPEILHLPSELFYNGELVASKEDTADSVAWVDLLPNRDFPVLFVGIQGCDEREGSNPSWFNRFEISKVVEYIKILTESEGKKLNGEDIGVIAPYRQQVLKLSDILEHEGFSGIKVGSVEQFQGQEREVIVISTVRSTIKHNGFDKIHCLGFLSNPKRFNVAITRARSLLIVIGNPHIIGKDPHWSMLLWRCVDNGSYQGCPLPERQDSLQDYPAEDSYSAGYEGEQLTDDLKEWHLGNDKPWVSDEVEPEVQKPSVDESEWSDGWK